MKYITRAELKNNIDNGKDLKIVEVLPFKYWKEGHIPGSIQMDYKEIIAKANKLIPDKNAKIVVYCASTECQNSKKAANILQSLGYKEVFEYVDGKQDWTIAGFPIVSEN